VFPFRHLPLELRKRVYNYAALPPPAAEATTLKQDLGQQCVEVMKKMVQVDLGLGKEMRDLVYAQTRFENNLC
jgi:hypothetical protein